VWRTKSCETLQAKKVSDMNLFLRKFFSDELGQDLAEYAIMMAVLLVIVMGTVSAIAASSGVRFSSVASSIQ
jgi:Flp pilus assembly pilin Flp